MLDLSHTLTVLSGLLSVFTAACAFCISPRSYMKMVCWGKILLIEKSTR